jgi:hypothetical protein
MHKAIKCREIKHILPACTGNMIIRYDSMLGWIQEFLKGGEGGSTI